LKDKLTVEDKLGV